MNSPKQSLIEQGKINEFRLMKFLEYYKYSNIKILQQLLNLSFSGIHKFINRMESKEIVNTHICKRDFTKIKIIGMTIHGIHVLANYRYERLPSDATEEQKDHILNVDESSRFYISKFSPSRYYHNIAIQQLHVELLNNTIETLKDTKIIKIEIPVNQRLKLTPNQRRILTPLRRAI
jgi:DNA-binding MarR family transcriptional regulator